MVGLRTDGVGKEVFVAFGRAEIVGKAHEEALSLPPAQAITTLSRQ